MAPDDKTAQALHVDTELAAMAAWDHALTPTPDAAYKARVACAELGFDYYAAVLVCQRRNEDLVHGPVDARIALEEVARALSRAADRFGALSRSPELS